MSDVANLRDAVPLAGTGVRLASALHANLTAPALVAHSLRKGEGRLSAEGAIIVRTGVHTGRSTVATTTHFAVSSFRYPSLSVLCFWAASISVG